MIHQQDFIMRQIQQFTDVLVQIITKKKQGEYEEAKQLADATIDEIIEEEEQDAEQLSLQQTLALVENKARSNEVILHIANIFFEKKNLLPHTSARHCALQALLLYKKAAESSAVAFPLADLHKMNALQEQFKGSPELAEITSILRKA